MKDESTHDSGTAMNRPHPNDDLLLDLLNDKLALNQRARVLEHLSGCGECAGMLREIAADREVIRSERYPQFAPDGRVELVERREGGDRWSPPATRLWKRLRDVFDGNWRGRLVPIAGIVLSVILVLALLWPKWHAGVDEPELFVIADPRLDHRLRSGLSETPDDRLHAGLQAYAQADYRRAVQLLRAAPVEGTLALLRDVYLGSAAALGGDHEFAAEVLEPLLQHELPDPWESEALWTLFVAWKLGADKARGDSLLLQLLTEPGIVGRRARDWQARNPSVEIPDTGGPP